MRKRGAIAQLLGTPGARAVSSGDVETALAQVGPKTFRTVKSTFKLDKKTMSTVLSVGERTVDRMLDPGYKTPLDLADRVLRIARVFGEAEEALEDRDRAVRWLTSPVPALRGQVPLAMLRTDLGAKLVSDELVRLKYGIYS